MKGMIYEAPHREFFNLSLLPLSEVQTSSHIHERQTKIQTHTKDAELRFVYINLSNVKGTRYCIYTGRNDLR